MNTQSADFVPHISRLTALLVGVRTLITTIIYALLESHGFNDSPAAEFPPKHSLSRKSNGINMSTSNELLDSVAVNNVIMRERLARESHDWAAEADCFHPDAVVEVSWFKGSGAEFVTSAEKNAAATKHSSTDTVNFDSMGPAVVTVKNDRAIANTACAVHRFYWLDGIEVSMTSYTRLLWRARKFNGQWLIAGLRGIYIRDILFPRNPNEVVKLDEERLNEFRPSYRYLSYILAAQGQPAHNDLPGVDQPETVAALTAAECAWLEQN
jgi:hypothetical protein